MRVVERLGIAGAVGEEHAVGLVRSTSSAVAVPGRTVTRQPRSTRCRGMFHFMPKSSATTCERSVASAVAASPLASPSGRPDASSRCSWSCHSNALLGHHFADQVAADQAGARLRLGDQAGVVEIGRREHALHRAARCAAGGPATGCRCRLDADDAVLLQIIARGFAPSGSCCASGSARGRRSRPGAAAGFRRPRR